MVIYIAGREWSSKCWLPGPAGDPGVELEVMAPRPGDLEVTTAALAVITGNLLVLHLLVRFLLVLLLLVRFLLVLHLLVRILLVLATPAGIELSNNFSRNRTHQESNSASATRPCKLTNVRCTTTVARRPNDPPYDLYSAAAATR
jgi:hypothetical protein